MNPRLTVVLFTSCCPYDLTSEQAFLEAEFSHLQAQFDRVIIVPRLREGKRLPLPEGIIVEEGYSTGWHGLKKHVHLALSSPLLYKDIVSFPSIWLRRSALRRLLKHVAEAEYTRNWIYTFITEGGIKVSSTLFYTYWLESWTTGLGLAKKRFPGLTIVSRAHRYDLYEDRRQPAYIPCRRTTLKTIDRLFLISEHGKQYITEKYPWVSGKCEVSRLGSADPGFTTSSSSDGTFRIVSCSSMTSVKRVDLLLNGIVHAATSRPNVDFSWHHIGAGPLRKQIEDMAGQKALPNLICCFTGSLPHKDVLSFYRKNSVDVFVNVSASEGIPVSIMEAQSCSIPVIATAVGGNPEIVSDSNGKLLPPNPTPEEVGTGICEVLDTPEWKSSRKDAGRRIWQEKYNAQRNFGEFSIRLRSMI